MNDPQDKAVTEQAAADGERDKTRLHQAARRSLLRGAAAAPVLMSLASRPVMGGGSRCCTASGFMSGNASPQPGTGSGCGGYSPGYWKNKTGSWPSSCKTTAKFHDIFTSKLNTNCGTQTMLQVLQNLPGSLAFHAIGCYLNASSSLPDYSLTTTMVVKIWNDVSNNGYYLTSTGQKMYADDAKRFFEQTYH